MKVSGLSCVAAMFAVTMVTWSPRTAGASSGTSRVHLGLTSIEQLHVGQGSYEAWLLIAGTPRSLGKFQMDADNIRMRDLLGNLFTDNILMTTLDVSRATELWVTVEPDGDTDSTPAWRFLAGDVTPLSAGIDSCTFNVKHANGLHADFTDAAGSFLLTTPTDASNTDENSGLWFMTTCGGGAGPSLSLPALPGGTYAWTYTTQFADVSEGDAIPYFTGNFTSTTSADADGGGCAAGPLAAPPFPGSDFVVDNGLCTGAEPILPALNDGHWSVVVRAQPAPFMPPLFSLKPLQVSVILAGTPSCAGITLQNFSGDLPRGTATLVPGTTPVRPTSWGSLKQLYRR